MQSARLASYEVKNGQAVAGDSYRLQVEKARFEYEKKQEQLADTQITSPIDGTVVRSTPRWAGSPIQWRTRSLYSS